MSKAYKEAAAKAMECGAKAHKSATQSDHEMAAGYHRIAAEHAVMCGDTDASNMHKDHAEMHSRAAEREKRKASDTDRSVLLRRLNEVSSKRMAGKPGLEASVKGAGFSLNDLQEQVQSEVADMSLFKPEAGCCSPYCCDIVAPEHEAGEVWQAVVRGNDNKLYCLKFEIEQGEIKLVGEPEEVDRTTDYDFVSDIEAEARRQAKGGVQAADFRGNQHKSPQDVADEHSAAARVASRAANASSRSAVDQATHNAAAIANLAAKQAHETAAAKQRAAGNDDDADDHDAKAKLHAGKHEVHAAAASVQDISDKGSTDEGKDAENKADDAAGDVEARAAAAAGEMAASNPEGINQYSKNAGASSKTADKASSEAKGKSDHDRAADLHDKAREAHEQAQKEHSKAAQDAAKKGDEIGFQKHFDKAMEHKASAEQHREAFAKHSTAFEPGTSIKYNDGRPGHTDAGAKVLSSDKNGMTVQFHDRADTTHIKFDDKAWMDHIKPHNASAAETPEQAAAVKAGDAAADKAKGAIECRNIRFAKPSVAPVEFESKIIALKAKEAGVPGDPVEEGVIMYMPGGTFTITPSQDGQPVTVTVLVNEATAATVERQRQSLQAAGKKPFFSVQHDTEIAAFWPEEFFWARRVDATGNAKWGVWARGMWSKSGKEAVEGRDFRTFSPTFFVDAIRTSEGDPAMVVCNEDARANMGALENDPAFQEMSPLWCSGKACDAPRAAVPTRRTLVQMAHEELRSSNPDLAAIMRQARARFGISVTEEEAAAAL